MSPFVRMDENMKTNNNNNPPPFPESHQLDIQLRLASSDSLVRADGQLTLPGQPRVVLKQSEIERYMEKDILVPTLDQLAPKLWLVSTPRFSHISALHHQAVRGRHIVLTENPQLHLVWYYDKIYIKPIPRDQRRRFRKAAIGFMRTYAYLVEHESDFVLAQKLGLVPGIDIITWESFARFIIAFDNFEDLDKLSFHPVNVQWGTVLNGFVTPLITVFVIASVVLSAMQVYLAVKGLNIVPENAALIGASEWFSVVVMIAFATLTGILVLSISFFFFHGLWFSRHILHKKKKVTDVESNKSGTV
ncbi:MAG: hypothetical protein MMC33_006794 [Icmadophila ericetorum]|nr:hypothetical protein [Icmadophila ericetorum]